jgi:hypothetical protein
MREELSQLYQADTMLKLQAAAGLLEAGNPDAYAATQGARSFCSYATRFIAPGENPATDQVPDTVAARASLQQFVQFARHYCAGIDHTASKSSNYFDDLVKLVEQTTDVDFRRVIDITESDASVLSADDQVMLRTELQEIMARTESPEVLFRAGNALAGGQLGAWDLGEAHLKNMAATWNRLELQSIAVQLASCRLSSGCGPGSLMAMRLCAPAYCAQGMDANAYFAHTLSTPEFAIVMQMVDDIFRMRSRKR